ncbi:MAG: hypothetical protein ACQEQL_05330 [Pseudomonadota bacterium]
MSEFHTSLVREKIIFDDFGQDGNDPFAVENVIRSNRMVLDLERANERETVVVRAQNMHSTLRMAAKVINNFYKGGGSFQKREAMPNWKGMWDQTLSAYEQDYNRDNLWGAVYIDGKAVFRTRQARFMDIIEQCALVTRDEYDTTKDVAEYALKQLGRDIKITHQSNIAALIVDKPEGLRCGISHRSDGKDTVFNFLMQKGAARTDRINHGFIMAAAFLEGINLGYTVRRRRTELAEGKISKNSKDVEQMNDARERQMVLNREIIAIEELYKINYRPEKPNFLVVG